MSDAKLMSKAEILLLEEVDKGTSIEEIAAILKTTVDQAKSLIQAAEEKRAALDEIVENVRVPTAYIRAVDDRLNVTQKGTMKVGSQILRYLSEGIYSSPAASLKELISNSFDSDSPTVDLTINGDEVTIKDKGHGMNWRDFDEDFTFISRSAKRARKGRTKVYNRPVIGFLGIGFISVAELCDTMVIRSCKENEDKFFVAEIDFSRFRTLEVTDKEFYEVSEYRLTNYLKEEYSIAKEASFTEIKLKNLQQGFKNILQDREPFDRTEVTISKLVEYVTSEGIGITDLGQYWKMIWEIACMAPVRYLIRPDKPLDKTILLINSVLESYNFVVKINGKEIVKPFRFPMSDTLEPEGYAIHTIDQSMLTSKGKLSFKGYVYSQHGMISPKEYIGLLLRIKNVAIGPIDRNLLDYPSGSNQMFRNWIFGEIYIEEGLEDAININRNQFKLTDANYIALRKWIHEFLEEIVFKHTLHYYREGSEQREEERKAENKETLRQITKKEMGEDYRFQYHPIAENQPLNIDRKEKTVTVNSEYPSYRMTSNLKPIVQRMLLLFEIAVEKSNGDVQKLRRNFQEELEKWLR